MGLCAGTLRSQFCRLGLLSSLPCRRSCWPRGGKISSFQLISIFRGKRGLLIALRSRNWQKLVLECIQLLLQRILVWAFVRPMDPALSSSQRFVGPQDPWHILFQCHIQIWRLSECWSDISKVALQYSYEMSETNYTFFWIEAAQTQVCQPSQ